MFNLRMMNILDRKWAMFFCAFLFSLIAVTGLTSQTSAEPPSVPADDQHANWKAGIATVVITPEHSMWMAGYAARKKPSEGKVHDLYAKALALEDSQGTKLVVVTADLLGFSRSLRDWLEKEVGRRYQLAPEELLLNASHTHCGPVVHDTKPTIYGDSFYGLSSEQIQQNQIYYDHLRQKLLKLVGEALSNMAPARLAYTHARAGFAMNRRLKTEQGYHIRPNPDGPVDHDVPVLRIDSPEGNLRAVLFGYACHSTTLSLYKFCGDYVGFAQQYLEESHPGVTALFITGCAGDQNPYPRRGPNTLEYSRHHGRALAVGVEAALVSQAQPVRGPIRAALEQVTLDFAKPPSREQLDQQANSDNKYDRRHAKVLLKELEQTGKICTTYPYLVHVVQFGNDLTLVAMAGEVVVDYSLRFKKELIGPPVWVAAYSNDVFGYIPSLRVLQEGGYEGGGAMLYTELPGPFAPSVEKRIVKKVHELVKKVRTDATAKSPKNGAKTTPTLQN